MAAFTVAASQCDPVADPSPDPSQGYGRPVATDLDASPPAGTRRIIAFTYSAPNRAAFSIRDRIELTTWSNRSPEVSVGRVRLEQASPDDSPDVAEFLLLYPHDSTWARWGVAPTRDRRFMTWSMVDGHTIGYHGTLIEALECVAGA